MAYHTAVLANHTDIAGWRQYAHTFLASGVAPERIVWTVAGAPAQTTDLFGGILSAPVESSGRARKEELDFAFDENSESRRLGSDKDAFSSDGLFSLMLLHKAQDRFARAYHLLWRLRTEPHLLKIASDPAVAQAEAMAKAVRRDMHKTKAFVRFRRVENAQGEEIFIAWFEPEHHSLAATAPFFTRRFANMRWSILSPEVSAHWDLARLVIGAGADRRSAPDHDELEDIWRTYYGAIFNPARLKTKAMMAEMPKKYWKNLPEADLIAPLIRSAEARAQTMIAAEPSTPKVRKSFYGRD